MIEITQKDVSTIQEAIDSIFSNLGMEEVNKLEKNCVDLYSQAKDINTCVNICNKINEMNKRARNLQKDTIDVCKNVANLVNSFKVVANK